MIDLLFHKINMLCEGHNENDLHKFRRLNIEGKTGNGKPTLVRTFRIRSNAEHNGENHQPHTRYKQRDCKMVQQFIVIKQGNDVRHNQTDQGGCDLDRNAPGSAGTGIGGSGKSKYAQRGHSKHR